MLFNKISTNVSLLNTCFFHTSQQNAGISKSMLKVMSGVKKRKHIYSDVAMPTSNSFTKDLFKKNNPENTRRLSMLNKMFMMRITDLMTSGDYASQLAGYGIEINKVKVAPDYQGLNVYWIAKESSKDKEIEDLLQSKSGELRHELSQLHVIGMVPKIKFVKDKEYARFMEVETRLALADFGDDYEQTDASLRMKSQLKLTKVLDPQLKERIKSLEQAEKVEEEEELPPMPQNVLGLNHSDIMNRVKKCIKKSQASHRHRSDTNENFIEQFNPDPVEFKSIKAQREALNQFLTERQILRHKSERLRKAYRPEWDYLEAESEMLKEAELNSFKFDQFNDNDYIEDDYGSDNDSKNKL